MSVLSAHVTPFSFCSLLFMIVPFFFFFSHFKVPSLKEILCKKKGEVFCDTLTAAIGEKCVLAEYCQVKKGIYFLKGEPKDREPWYVIWEKAYKCFKVNIQEWQTPATFVGSLDIAFNEQNVIILWKGIIGGPVPHLTEGAGLPYIFFFSFFS